MGGLVAVECGETEEALELLELLALMRYGFIDPSGKGLHDIWGMHNVTAEAWLSLAVVRCGRSL